MDANADEAIKAFGASMQAGPPPLTLTGTVTMIRHETALFGLRTV